MNPSIPVLPNRVSERAADDTFTVTPRQFVRYADGIAACGCSALNISELAFGLGGFHPLPALCVTIPFYAGCLDGGHNASPTVCAAWPRATCRAALLQAGEPRPLPTG